MSQATTCYSPEHCDATKCRLSVWTRHKPSLGAVVNHTTTSLDEETSSRCIAAMHVASSCALSIHAYLEIVGLRMPHRHENSHTAGGKTAVQSTAAQGQCTTVRHLQACPGMQHDNSTPTRVACASTGSTASAGCQRAWHQVPWRFEQQRLCRLHASHLNQQQRLIGARRLQDQCWADKTGCHCRTTAQHLMNLWLPCGVPSLLNYVNCSCVAISCACLWVTPGATLCWGRSSACLKQQATSRHTQPCWNPHKPQTMLIILPGVVLGWQPTGHTTGM